MDRYINGLNTINELVHSPYVRSKPAKISGYYSGSDICTMFPKNPVKERDNRVN